MSEMIIKGIDEVIKGLTTIKGALMAQGATTSIVEAVKEAVGEVVGSVSPANIVVTTEVVDVEKAVKSALSKSPVPEWTPSEGENTTSKQVDNYDEEASRAELNAMKYNDLKALAGTIEGASATGKKADIIDSIIKAEKSGAVITKIDLGAKDVETKPVEKVEPVDEEIEEELEEDEFTDDDKQGFIEFLESLDTDDIKDIATEAGYEVGKKVVKAKLIEKLVSDLDVLYNTLSDMGYYDEESDDEDVEDLEEDDVDDSDKIVDKYGLNDYSVEELADICSENDLSTKGKKQALIDRIVKGIMDGTIEIDDDEEEEEEVVEKPTKTNSKTKPSKKVEDDRDPAIISKESEVEADIRKKYGSKKLSEKNVKKFLEKYYDGDPDFKLGKLSDEEILECYINIHKALVDDSGDLYDFEEAYVRNNEYYCCGKEIKELDDKIYCSICGQEYEA